MTEPKMGTGKKNKRKKSTVVTGFDACGVCGDLIVTLDDVHYIDGDADGFSGQVAVHGSCCPMCAKPGENGGHYERFDQSRMVDLMSASSCPYFSQRDSVSGSFVDVNRARFVFDDGGLVGIEPIS